MANICYAQSKEHTDLGLVKLYQQAMVIDIQFPSIICGDQAQEMKLHETTASKAYPRQGTVRAVSELESGASSCNLIRDFHL
jgi:hypothetical protein